MGVESSQLSGIINGRLNGVLNKSNNSDNSSNGAYAKSVVLESSVKPSLACL